jgi:hypothetical protein
VDDIEQFMESGLFSESLTKTVVMPDGVRSVLDEYGLTVGKVNLSTSGSGVKNSFQLDERLDLDTESELQSDLEVTEYGRNASNVRVSSDFVMFEFGG